ncbi:SDR family oxidoreductase [Sinimarinibacterium sp. NLF-5-8]|uniref:SDR family oxidoreductase n=1 Tax=Sinimarinibacterium sp. NLF-5-8 TaxID=2698684 RepID=UPI00137C1D8C|nr:SDR family oxidoreductase [Sinimarinibacterium sp. NLF-5-8]QHS10302.1 SDR family oxidoreductase [Sinimarinibacterium sp. NLF-5-8]
MSQARSNHPPAADSHLAYDGKVVVVSGGSSGIGLGISRHLAALGATVVILGRTQEKLDTAQSQIRTDNGIAHTYAVDVRDDGHIDAALTQCATQLGGIDLVVAAAAGNFFTPADKLSSKGFRTVVEIDLIGTFNVFSHALPHLRKPGASLLAITAPQAQRAMPNQVHACAAKAGIDMLVKCLALEWGKLGVRVNAVSPGPIAGTEGLARLSASPEIERMVRENTALKAFGDVDDIARAVAWLGSDSARYVTGSILDCDGGMRLGNFPAL